jgi:hypothetical protein
MASALIKLLILVVLAAIAMAAIDRYSDPGSGDRQTYIMMWFALFVGVTFLVLGVGGLVFAGTCAYYEGFNACASDAGFSALTIVWGVYWTYLVLRYIYVPLNSSATSAEDSGPLWPSDSVAH